MSLHDKKAEREDKGEETLTILDFKLEGRAPMNKEAKEEEEEAQTPKGKEKEENPKKKRKKTTPKERIRMDWIAHLPISKQAEIIKKAENPQGKGHSSHYQTSDLSHSAEARYGNGGPDPGNDSGRPVSHSHSRHSDADLCHTAAEESGNWVTDKEAPTDNEIRNGSGMEEACMEEEDPFGLGGSMDNEEAPTPM